MKFFRPLMLMILRNRFVKKNELHWTTRTANWLLPTAYSLLFTFYFLLYFLLFTPRTLKETPD